MSCFTVIEIYLLNGIILPNNRHLVKPTNPLQHLLPTRFYGISIVLVEFQWPLYRIYQNILWEFEKSKLRMENFLKYIWPNTPLVVPPHAHRTHICWVLNDIITYMVCHFLSIWKRVIFISCAISQRIWATQPGSEMEQARWFCWNEHTLLSYTVYLWGILMLLADDQMQCCNTMLVLC